MVGLGYGKKNNLKNERTILRYSVVLNVSVCFTGHLDRYILTLVKGIRANLWCNR